MSLCGYVHMSTVALEARGGHRIPLELEFQEIVLCPAWMLGTEPGFSVTASALRLSSPLSCSLKLHKVDAFILPCASVLNGNEGTLRFSSHC